MDLDRLSVQELTALIANAEAKRQEKLQGARDAFIQEMRSKAADLGISLEALFAKQPATPAKGRTGSSGSSLPAKYRGPQGEEWSGRGRTPRWLVEIEASGRSRREFEV